MSDPGIVPTRMSLDYVHRVLWALDGICREHSLNEAEHQSADMHAIVPSDGGATGGRSSSPVGRASGGDGHGVRAAAIVTSTPHSRQGSDHPFSAADQGHSS